MKYKYTATQPDGKMVEGDLEAKDTGEVLNFLSSQSLKPINVTEVKAGGFGSKNIQLFGGGISMGDQIFLSKYIALMLRIGTSLLQAINILIDDFKKPAVKEFLMEVRSNLERGQQFYLAFAKHPGTFSQVYINLVRSGEASGNLEKVFVDLTNSLTKEKKLKDDIKGALTYPVILLITSGLILVFMVTFALPKIAKVFSESGFQPPLFSRLVFKVGLFFGKFGIYVIILGGIGIGVMIFLMKTSLVFRRLVFGLMKEMPLVKDIVKKMAIQRFAATLASLIKAGMPITDALEITAETVGETGLRDALIRISKEGLAKGLTVGEAFKREPYFPSTVVNLIAISEKAGHIEEVLDTLSDFYAGEIDSALKGLVTFLEPILLVGIGGFIGLIALSVIMPIYQLTTQF